MSTQYNLFDSQKSGEYTDNGAPLFNAQQLDGASQQSGQESLPPVVMDLHGSMGDSDDADNNGMSLVYKNDDEHGDDASDMHLSFVYRPPSEDDQGMVLSANPAWMQLLDSGNLPAYDTSRVRRNSGRGNEPEPDSDHHRRRSFLSVNSSQKSAGGEQGGHSRRRSFMTVDSAGGSDVVAVQAGEIYFFRAHRLSYTSFHTPFITITFLHSQVVHISQRKLHISRQLPLPPLLLWDFAHHKCPKVRPRATVSIPPHSNTPLITVQIILH